MAWFGKGQGSQWQPPPLQVPDREKHHGWLMADRWDPAATVRRWRETGMQTGTHQVYSNPKTRMHLGFRDATLNTSVGVPWVGRCNGWAWTNEQTHVLVLGPPRTPAGKTASVMVPIVLSQFGPVVTLSTKRDIYTATAMARAYQGRLWWYAPDGDTAGVPPSVRQLHWSPVVGAAEWDTALQTTHAFMAAAPVGAGTTDADHWRSRAEDLMAPMLHWAALSGLQMADFVAAVQDFARKGPAAADELERRGAVAAARMLRGILHTPERERGSVISAAQTALRAYRRPPVLASTEPPYFDVDDFLAGGPDGTRADTIYITATSDQQDDIAPLVVALLDQIKAAVYRRHRALETAGTPRHHRPWPVTFVLDELYGLARLPNLAELLTTAGSQGLLIVGAVQDLSLLAARWPKEAKSFDTLFGQILVFPGIGNWETLEQISKTCGEWDRPRTSTTAGHTDGSVTTTRSTERARVYPVDQITRGVDPAANERLGIPPDPDVVLCLQGGHHFPLMVSPYWRAAPWPQLLTNYLALAVNDTAPAWLATDPEHPSTADVLAGLPVPDLEEWADHSCTVFCGVELNRDPPPWPWNANAANAWWIGKVAWESGFQQAEGS